MSQLTSNSSSQIMDAIAGVRRKARAFSVLHGFGVVLASAVGLLLAVVLLDYILNLPTGPRLVFVAVAAGVVGVLAWRRVAKPIAARLSLGDVAGHLENAFPEFDDRLRSTVDFVNSDVPGSPTMKDHTIREAERLALQVDLSRALLRKPVLLSLGMAIAAIAIAAMLSFSFQNLSRIAISRLGGASTAWPKRCQIETIGQIPAKIASGQRLDMRLRMIKGDREGLKPVAYVRYDGGPAMQVIMSRNDDGTYSAAVDAKARQKLTVWMKAGDDQTLPREVTVVERLSIQSVQARITPPAYAKQEAGSANLTESPATVVYGCTIELSIVFNNPLAADKPVELLSVKPDEPLPNVEWARANGSSPIGRFTALNSIRFRVRAQDTDHFENAGIEEFEILVRPDQLPTVVIENPRGPEDRTPVATVPLEVMAEDDFGITTMTLVVDRINDKKHWDIPLANWQQVESAGERHRYRLRHPWDLSQLADAKLQPGEVLEYFVKVTDNYDYNGAKHEPVASGKLKINIISQEALAQQIIDAMRVVADRTRATQNTENRQIQETGNLRKDTEQKPRLDPGDRTALSRLAEQQSSLAAQTKQVANRVADLEQRMNENKSDNKELKDIAKDVKNLLNDTAENAMNQAAQKLNEAAQKADTQTGKNDKPNKEATEQRNDAMQKSEGKQKEASDQLGKAIERMNNLGSFEQMLSKVREALANQEKLSKQTSDAGKEMIGKKPEELTADQKKKLDDIAKEQQNQAKNTEKLTQELDKMSKQSQKSDPSGSEAMKQASQTAQQQQVSQNQQQASQSAQQNQQANAQAKQKQAELGLRMMLDTMREAERRKLEQLARDLAKLEQLINELVRRQAGHNVDNLRIQDNASATKLLTDELLQKAEVLRDKFPSKPTGEQLKDFQANTERRTRDYTKTAEEMQSGGAEIAALLSKAAGFMERAVALIRDASLAEAFDPSQSKALSTLEEARKRTAELLAQAQQKLDDANRETVRQKYEKIREEQAKVNKETLRIDGARKPDGSLDRRDAMSLGKLPGQQGELADTTKKIEEDLSALGGIVYVWANKDIVESMNEVKDDLAKPTTAEPTQTEEARIVEQLDAMIRNLAEKPHKNEMEKPPGGGGGGGSPKPKLPSEAELRLLKELQMAVNKATKILDKLKNPDKPKLVSLGGRQGEFRGLLDQLLQKASDGQVKLDPEPDPKERLPEEADTAKIENQELDDWLKGAKSGDDQLTSDIKQAGQRMGRSRQRLALDHDPGKTTQLIQDRVLDNLDHLIQLAQAQQAQASSKSGKPGQQKKPGDQQDMGQQQTGQSQPNNSSNPAQREATGGSQSNQTDPNKDIREGASEWGGLTPRERQAIIEGTHEKSIGKYEKITRDYYEALGKKATQQP
ncbi:MAG: hypothetical protein ABSH20_07480 [Tepidisphaeraceae bacterium]